MDYNIKILPEAESFLECLPAVLQKNGYKNDYAHAVAYVDEIIDFINDLSNAIHCNIPDNMYYHYEKYGRHLQYSFFKRKESKTTWYIFFEQKNDMILVKHISNNWIEGQYLRE